MALGGCHVGELAARYDKTLPRDLRRHKGVVGELLELALGASAGSRPVPDFEHLGIELKSIPLGRDLRPLESTHVCTVAADDLARQSWMTSTVRRKLTRVLWMPVEGTRDIPLEKRRVGRAVLWSPSAADEAVLRADWEEHMELIATGRQAELDGRLGTYLQVRPKAANGVARQISSDATGVTTPILPRGFYLRAAFTVRILEGAP